VENVQEENQKQKAFIKIMEEHWDNYVMEYKNG